MPRPRWPPAYPPHPKTTPDINAADLSIRDKAVADDSFKGRGPGTKVGEMASLWIANEMKRIGLKPGNKGSYFQNVPAVTIKLDPATPHSLRHGEGRSHAEIRRRGRLLDAAIRQRRSKGRQSQLVFVGYGVIAPEYNWNDYAGVDVKGKTVVILINDPATKTPRPTRNSSRARP